MEFRPEEKVLYFSKRETNILEEARQILYKGFIMTDHVKQQSHLLDSLYGLSELLKSFRKRRRRCGGEK